MRASPTTSTDWSQGCGGASALPAVGPPDSAPHTSSMWLLLAAHDEMIVRPHNASSPGDRTRAMQGWRVDGRLMATQASEMPSNRDDQVPRADIHDHGRFACLTGTLAALIP